jgi:HPt (histidine-containing phosphotransfer) domain-containing protein
MTGDDEMDEVVAGLRAQFRASLSEHADAIKKAWGVLSSTVDERARREAAKLLLRHVHRLAGAGPTLGLAALGTAAALVEEMVREALEAGRPLATPPPLAPLVAQLLLLCESENGLSLS